MSTNRNTKGQFARKTAPKKPVKKPTQLDRIEKRLGEIEERLARQYGWYARLRDENFPKLHGKLDQIQRDIDLLKSGSSFMQEVEQHKAAAEEQGLEDGDYCDASPELLADLWKMGFEKDPGRFRPFVNWHAKRRTMITHDVLTGYEGRPFRQLPPADFLSRACVTAKKMGLVPEEPKAEPWVPKENELATIACEGVAMRIIHHTIVVGDWWTMVDGSEWPTHKLRKPTSEEIAEAERSEKLKKLVRGCRVDTPDGEGIYLGRDAAMEGHYWVSLDREAVIGITDCFHLDQLTPLT